MNNGHFTDLGNFIRSQSKLLPVCGGSKNALGIPEDASPLHLKDLNGVLEYEPSEFTFTAFAGTRLLDINPILASNGQFLPFDPLLVKRGATLGGTVAAGMSGPGRYQFGGVRDFILGVKYLDAQGQLVKSGGKVVKNAAGFDVSKLMVGSLGSLGAIVELSFKVFPRPKEFLTLIVQFPAIEPALKTLTRLSAMPIEFNALDLEPGDGLFYLKMRLGGENKLFLKRIEKFKGEIGEFIILDGSEENAYWESIQEFSWHDEENVLVKVPTTIKQLIDLEEFLVATGSARRYSTAANVAWISWVGSINKLDHFLAEHSLAGLTILGAAEKTKLGDWSKSSFYLRVKNALDPTGKWAEV